MTASPGIELRALTTEQVQAHYEAALAGYRDMAKRFPYDDVTLGDLQTARRELRAAQYELLVRNQKEAA